eukprot:1395389-Amorphochlora_amoeboformis.AAC.1
MVKGPVVDDFAGLVGLGVRVLILGVFDEFLDGIGILVVADVKFFDSIFPALVVTDTTSSDLGTADGGTIDEGKVDEATVDEGKATVDEGEADEATVDEGKADEASVDEATVDEGTVDEDTMPSRLGGGRGTLLGLRDFEDTLVADFAADFVIDLIIPPLDAWLVLFMASISCLE